MLGILKDKDYQEMLDILLRPEDRVVLTTPDSERAAEPAELLPYVRSECREAVADAAAALQRGHQLAREIGEPNNTLLICAGSLYLIGALRELLVK